MVIINYSFSIKIGSSYIIEHLYDFSNNNIINKYSLSYEIKGLLINTHKYFDLMINLILK